jgi:glycosyltransferase involved in cell wall biosynthesis
MIVKNESKVILRCLNSVLKYIDTYCICDTGSTDNTQQIITDFFNTHKIKGQLLSHPWKNFGHNRTLAVQAAKGTADYLLLMDADFIFKITNPDFKKKQHTASSLLIKYEGLLDYRQPLMVRGDLDWRYIGVTHEYIHCPNTTRILCDDFTFEHVGDGANKDDKFERDIQLLTDGLIEEPNNYRYYFYLAQSHKDLAGGIKHTWQSKQQTSDKKNPSNHHPTTSDPIIQNQITLLQAELHDLESKFKYHFTEAIKAYTIRSKHHDFPEEVYYSLYMLGHCHYHLGSDAHIYTGYFLEAYSYRPQRLEALFQLIKYYRLQQKYTIAYDLGHRGADQPYPKTDCLFIDTRIHRYLFKHEVAVAAYYLGEYDECLRLINIILNEPDLPEVHRKTIMEHKRMTDLKVQERTKLNQQSATTNSLTPTATNSLTPALTLTRQQPLITLFSYNFLHTGGSEISDWGLLQHLAQTSNYQIKHSRDYREIYQDRPNLILAQQFAIEKAVIIGEELGIPVIVTQHGPSQWGHAKINSNYFIFNSHHLLKSELPRANFQHYDIIYPRIDCDKFLRIQSSDPNSTKRQFITFLGRLTKEKGIDLFIKLSKRMPNHQFLCVGGDIAEIIRLKTEYNLEEFGNLTFEEFTTQVEQVYERTKLLILPSHYESFGMVTVEASLCGIPIIATTLPGIKEATNNQSNYVDSFDNLDLWEDKINQVLSEMDLQIKTAIQIGQTYQEKYSDQITRFKYNIDRLLKGQNPTSYTRGTTFSITITVYNRPEQVIRAMESIRNQTYQEWEMIIIDDCSTDNTWQTLLEYDEQWGDDYRIKLSRNDINRGTFYSRNVGIQEATGDFIINLDSDDLLIPSALERLKDTIWKNDAKIVQFKYYRDDISSANPNTHLLSHTQLDQMAEDPKYRDHANSSWGFFCFNRQYIIDHVGYYDPIRYGADTEFMCRLKNFHQVTNLNQVIYYATDSPAGLSHQINQEWSNQYLRNFFKWYKDTKDKNEPIYITFDRDSNWSYTRPFPLPDPKST